MTEINPVYVGVLQGHIQRLEARVAELETALGKLAKRRGCGVLCSDCACCISARDAAADAVTPSVCEESHPDHLDPPRPKRINYRCTKCGVAEQSGELPPHPALKIYPLPPGWKLVPCPVLEEDDHLHCAVCIERAVAPRASEASTLAKAVRAYIDSEDQDRVAEFDAMERALEDAERCPNEATAPSAQRGGRYEHAPDCSWSNTGSGVCECSGRATPTGSTER